jgi:gliding motility-associated protein GldM
MASGNLSPRQKMINMMYLVLTALLALNVSKEILDAFVVVNMGLLQQKANLETKNDAMVSGLGEQLALDSGNQRLRMLYGEAKQITVLSSGLSDYIETMKVELVKKVDGVDEPKALEIVKQPSLVSKKDDYDQPTRFFGTASAPGTSGKANELKQQLKTYREQLLAIVEKVIQDSSVIDKDGVRKNMQEKLMLLNTNDPTGGKEIRTWEMQYFYHLPLSAALTELTKWQNFVKGAESDMLTFLWNETSRKVHNFDRVRAAVIPVSNFVMSGSDFEADVFLAAYSTSPTNRPEIVFGSGTDPNTGQVMNPVTLPMENIVNGVGKIKLPANGSGERTFAGLVRMTDANGMKKEYPFSTTYNVAPPMATISATQMNVFYRGVPNPLSVSVPGVAPQNVSVSCTGCTVQGSNGNYTVTAGTGNKATINVSARMPDGSVRSMGTQDYRVKPIPTPPVTLSGVESNKTISKTVLLNGGLVPDLNSFLFNFPVTIRSYDIFCTGGFGENGVQGNTLSQRAKNVIQGLPKGAKVYFDNIKVGMPDGVRTTNAVFIIQ